MEGLVKEYANFLNDDKKPAISEAVWKVTLLMGIVMFWRYING